MKDSDVMILEVIIEDEFAGSVDQGELQDWADTYGLTMPVVYDPSGAYMWSHITSGSVGLPYIEVLDQGAVVDTLGYADVSRAESLAAD